MTKHIFIDNRKIGDGQKVFIIAEAGVNHNGSLKLAKKMIAAAKSCGADAVKFQTFKAEELVIRNAPKANYQRKTVPGKTQYEMLKGLELQEQDFIDLFDYSRRKKIVFLSTPFSLRCAEFLNKIKMPAFKISSGEITNTPLLKQVAGYGKPIILSTGMSNLREVREAVKAIYSEGNRRLVLLQCTSNYPAKFENVNLKAMETIRSQFGVPVGYSDHTEGVEASIAASALGACIIEKHFTLNRNFKGPDHKASIEPDDFKEMVKCIRNVEKAIGNGVKSPAQSEYEVMGMARKSIVAGRDISKGAMITREDLDFKRPGTGLAPSYMNKIIGKIAKNNIRKDRMINKALVK